MGVGDVFVAALAIGFLVTFVLALIEWDRNGGDFVDAFMGNLSKGITVFLVVLALGLIIILALLFWGLILIFVVAVLIYLFLTDRLF